MRRLLVIQPDPEEGRLLERHLTETGYSVCLASGGGQGIELARRFRPDLILLDSALPDMSDKEVCKALKREARTALSSVVILSEGSSELDRVVAFELGVDDFVSKPASLREISLRIEAILRRTRRHSEPRTVDEFGRLRVDRQARRVWVDQAEIALTALEFNLLVALYDRRGRTRSRQTLLHEVWQTDFDPATRTVDQHVKRLRERLGPAGQYIETVRREGYRFVRDVGPWGSSRSRGGGQITGLR